MRITHVRLLVQCLTHKSSAIISHLKLKTASHTGNKNTLWGLGDELQFLDSKSKMNKKENA